MARDCCRSPGVPQGDTRPSAWAAERDNGLVRGVSEPARVAEPTLLPGDEAALDAFAAAALDLVQEGSLEPALAALARAVAVAVGAQVVVLRLAEGRDRRLVARAVHAESAALAAELEGTKIEADEIGPGETEFASAPGDPAAPAAVRRIASHAGAPIARVIPLTVDGEVIATLELFRSGLPFGFREQTLARVAITHLATAVRVERAARSGGDGSVELTQASLELLGEALAAGADESETAEQVVRLAAEATDATGALLWRLEPEAAPELLATHGLDGLVSDVPAAAQAVQRALGERTGEPEGSGPYRVYTLPLGEPPVAAVQLYFDEEAPAPPELERLSPFAARAALALRRSRRVGLVTLALRRSQTLVAVVSQAIAHLSLAHTLETAVERVATLTSSSHVAVYLREEGRLSAAAARGLAGAHTDLAERLLELALGPFRSRGYLFIEDMRVDPRLAGLEPVLRESRIRRALFIPLIAHEEVIGALAVFKQRSRPYREGEEGLLIALSSQLAVAVQNARLHERTKELGEILEKTLESERSAARQLRGLYEISHSFAESLSLEATLDAVVKTVVDLFGLDAAAIRMADGRGEQLEARAVYVSDPKVRAAAEAILRRPQPLSVRSPAASSAPSGPSFCGRARTGTPMHCSSRSSSRARPPRSCHSPPPARFSGR
jgi:GAF domain-containing protein